MQKSGKLELTWVGKYEETKIEPRILVEDANGFDFSASNNCWEHAEIIVEEERRTATIPSLLIACFIFVSSFN